MEKEAREGSHGEGDGAPKWREELEREGEERERREVRGKWEREEEVAKAAPREKSRFYRQHSNSSSHVSWSRYTPSSITFCKLYDCIHVHACTCTCACIYMQSVKIFWDNLHVHDTEISCGNKWCAAADCFGLVRSH